MFLSPRLIKSKPNMATMKKLKSSVNYRILILTLWKN